MTMTNELAATLPRRPSLGSPLTTRQREVLELVAAGVSEGEIAARLYITEDTVGKHLERARAKLGARTKPHLVDLAWRCGLLGDRRDRQGGDAG